MFDIGWSELVLIGVVALIAIGPKELPGVLRTVGQWMGKARRMAAEFQGQFQEAMREAEMADLKKSFDEVKEAASGFTGNNLMTSLQKDVSSALNIEDIDKPAEPPATPAIEPPATPTTPEAPTPQTFVEPGFATAGIVRISACQADPPSTSSGGRTTGGPQPASTSAAPRATSHRTDARTTA